MAYVKLILWPRKNKNGTQPIRIRITKGRKKSYIKTEYSVFKNQWEGEQVKNIENATRLNNLLTKLKHEAYEAAISLETRNTKVGVSAITRSLKNPYTDFFVFGRSHAEKYNNPQSILTYEKYKLMFKKFEAFLGKETLLLTDIDYGLLDDFRRYLFKPANKDKPTPKPSTVSSILSKVQAVYIQAINRRLVDRNSSPFYEFKVGRPTAGVKNKLSKREMDIIRKANITPDTPIWHARNIFLFQFNCMGMRIGDAITLKWDRIRDGRIDYQMRKSVDFISLKLTKEAMEILDLYSKDAEYVFPFLSRTNPARPFHKRIQSATARINLGLKKLCYLAELSATVTTHVARHSWANNARENGIADNIIGQGLGHARGETTKIYFSQFPSDILDNANEIATRR